jgi:hypothetical protein
MALIKTTKMTSNLANTSKFIQNNYDGGKFGLVEGYMGNSVIYFLLAKVFRNKQYAKRGRKMLEKVSANSELINDSNFKIGFTGIGWSIEWLVQENLMSDLDSDEMLLSIDEASKALISFKKDEDLSLFTGLLGNLKYFEKRLLSDNSNTNRYMKLSNLEALVVLTDDLDSRVINVNDTFNAELWTEGKFTIPDLGYILEICASAMKLNVSQSILEDILFKSIMFCDQLFSDLSQFSKCKRISEKNNLLNHLFLAITYRDAAQKYEHAIWISKAENYIDILSEKALNLKVMSEGLVFKKMSIFCLLYANQQKDHYRTAIINCLKILSTKERSSDLYMGSGNLVLAEICLNYPTAIKDWADLFFVT